MVLVGRDAAVAPDAFAVFVELIRMEQDAARCFDGGMAATGFRRNLDLFGLEALCQQFVDDFDTGFDDMSTFGQLCDTI